MRSGKERITQTNLYWFTLTPRATSSPQKPLRNPLCNQNQITNTTHQSNDLEPLKKHTTFSKTTLRVLILNTSRTHNTPWQHKYKNTVIKEEENRIHLSITKLKVQNTTQSYSTHLIMIQSSFKSWKNCF